MSKYFCRWLLPLFLLPSIVTVASAAVPVGTLLSVTKVQGDGINSSRHETSCIIKPGSAVISHTTTASGVAVISTETKSVKISAITIKKLIDQAATLGTPPSGGGMPSDPKYMAYQQQPDLTVKEINLGSYSSFSGMNNTVSPYDVLNAVINSICGNPQY